MAPGTNIGAAHPVTSQGKDIEGEMNEKVTNDAVAFMKSIAEQRGRDFSQLKEMVTNSRSFSAKEALKDGNIDFIVNDISGLLNKIDGQTINLPSEKTVVLNTAGSKTKSIVSGFRVNFLNFLSNPDVMYLLLLIGLIGVLFEIFNPGIFVAGIIGAFCLILSGYGMTLLPVNFAGLALIVLAMVLFLLEIKITSFGLLTLGGVVSLGSGAVFLVKAAPSFDVIGISWTVIIVSVILTALFFIFIIGLGLKAQLKKTGTGTELLKGKKGTVLKELSPKGQVRVNGEIWKAIAESENIPVETSVEVIEVNNFQLTVKPVSL
jgi:membrane-bound serine protease (ClpP class)